MPPTINRFRWTAAYRVNVAVLDQQHKKLFDTLNELDHMLHEAKGDAALDAVLQQLVHYAFSHFSTEESLMAKHEYPDLATHQAQHETLRRKVRDFLQD